MQRLNMLKRRLPLLLVALFFVLVAIPASGSLAKPEIYRHVSTTEKVIALTFDDGPHPKTTDKILDLLAEYGAKATFFVIGQNVALYGKATARAAREGHEIGNHTYTHPSASSVDDALMAEEILRTEEIVRKTAGTECHIFRPPGGDCADQVCRAATSQGLSIVLWNIDTRDWTGVSSQEITQSVMSSASPGAVILFHDYAGRDSGTVEALKEILPRLSAAGFRFVTVSELLDYSASASDASS